MIGADTVNVVSQTARGVARIRVGADTLAFDLRPIIRRHADSPQPGMSVPAEQLRIESEEKGRRTALAITQLSGSRTPDSVVVGYWSGTVLLGD
jgi:hypothetical protein